MLINPQSSPLVIPGTRFLQDPLGLPGTVVEDPTYPGREWTVQWLLSPIPGRYLGGIRAKLIDRKGFITFCNQRDLEVLLEPRKAGEYCSWTGNDYPSPGERDWYGCCCDEEDLKDDLFERECQLRQELNYPFLPQGIELRRLLHMDKGIDVQELSILLWDMDPETGYYPDTRLETVTKRWSRVEKEQRIWERL